MIHLRERRFGKRHDVMDWQKEASDSRFIDGGISRGAGFKLGIGAGNINGRQDHILALVI